MLASKMHCTTHVAFQGSRLQILVTRKKQANPKKQHSRHTQGHTIKLARLECTTDLEIMATGAEAAGFGRALALAVCDVSTLLQVDHPVVDQHEAAGLCRHVSVPSRKMSAGIRGTECSPKKGLSSGGWSEQTSKALCLLLQ
jgi:hypothetical protein